MSAVVIGFVGARKGLTPRQFAYVARRMTASRHATRFVHGGELGAAHLVHFVALATGIPVRIRPSDDEAHAAPTSGAVEVMRPMPAALRDAAIVDDCTVLVACPSGPEHARSETWAAIRYARRIGRAIVIVGTDGVAVTEAAR